ncbi:hypothetical protein ACV3Y9_15865, partial [Clostridium perfringens]
KKYIKGDESMIWSKLSSSINYYINKRIWGEELLKENILLLNQYIEDAFILEDGIYKYLDKKTYEYIDLSEEDMKKIEEAFIERLEKKRKVNKDKENFKNHMIMITDYLENEKSKEKSNVIELKNYRK